MNKNKIYDEFEQLSEKLGVKILKGKGDFAGGSCIIHNEKVIVINKMKPIEQRLNILAKSFMEYNLDDIYLVPALRSFIERHQL
tara:strand:- start:1475 stop:1726 length:252 start_codon:yes stop_codon:yes gene_type:complete